MVYLKNIKKENNDTISLEIHGLDICYANGIRRTLIGKIQTYAFTDIRVINNTSCLNNDMIKNRIELIPIKSESDLDDVEFKLKEIADDEITDIFTNSIKSSDGKKYFIDDILINTLKPGQSFEFIAYAKKNMGTFNAKHSPVGTASLEYITDPNLTKKLNKNDFNAITRSVKKDSYKLTIESVGHYPVEKLYPMAIEFIIQRCELLSKSIKEKNIEKVQILKYNPMDFTFDYIINDEDHTLGCLINYHNLNNKQCSYTGLEKPHPSEEKIKIRVSGNDKITADQIMIDSINQIIEICEDLKKEYKK